MVRKIGRKKMYRKKRAYRRRYRKRTPIPTAPKNHQIVKLRYTDQIRMDSIFGSQATYLWRINDTYDPNFSGVGHQPYFRDQLFTLYKYARCLWAKITVQIFINTTTSPCYFVLAPCQDGVMDSNFQTSAERKGSKETYINGQNSKKLTCKASVDWYFGQKKGTTMIDTTYLQNSSAAMSQGNSMWYGLGFVCLDSSNTGISAYCKVDIEQIVRFETPNQQTGS